MAQTKERQPLQQAILSRLEQKAERHFTWVDRMLLFFLLFYALAVIAIFALFAWEMGTFLPDTSCYLLPLLVAWTIVAGGYGAFMFRSIFDNHDWGECDPSNQNADCSENYHLEPSRRDEGHEKM